MWVQASARRNLLEPARTPLTRRGDVGLVVFVATYALIATERMHKTIAAMVGGVAMVLLGS